MCWLPNTATICRCTAEIYAREDIDLSRSTLADMVGQSARLLRPLVDVLGRHVMAGERVHADDTVVPVLEPGLGRTRTARLWVYVRDDRPFAGSDPAAVFYRYTADRKSVGRAPGRGVAAVGKSPAAATGESLA